MIRVTLENEHRICLHENTLFEMSFNAQWPVVGLHSLHPKLPSGTRARLRFHSNRRWLKTKYFCKGLETIFSSTLQSHDI